MKFRRIEFKEHPILGNCTFDFTDKDGKTLDTIIIAGENGCGKTVLLNELYELSFNNFTPKKNYIVRLELELSKAEQDSINEREVIAKVYPDGIPNIIEAIVDYKNRTSEIINPGHALHGVFLMKPSGEHLFKRIYSDVAINFIPKAINSVTAFNIDQKEDSVKSSTQLATDITQLLIDIKALDDSDLADWVKTHEGQIPPKEVQAIRMNRFTNAFSSIFEHKRFKGIDNIDGKKVILFEEYGHIMPIDKLSSGEKQIVFRGSFLLKDKKSIEGAYVLIDEPEISLHPKWQLEILPFIKSLFTDDSGTQTSQIIVATHSPFIIHNSNRRNDKVIIMQKSDDGHIQPADTPSYYSWTANQLVHEAFNINIGNNPNQRIVFVEGETDEKYYNKAIEVFGFNQNDIAFKWIGRNIEKGKNENTGDKALNNAAQFFKANKQMIHNPIILLYDCDTSKPAEDEGMLHIRKMEENKGNIQYKKGVENLLCLPKDFEYNKYYSYSDRKDEYGAPTKVGQLNKTLLCDDICSYENKQLTEILKNLKVEIDKIIVI